LEKQKKIDDLQKELSVLKKELSVLKDEKERRMGISKWLGVSMSKVFVGNGLIKSIENLLSELPNKVKSKTIAELSAHIIWRITRLGILAIIVALIPIILLFQQNSLLRNQNKLIEKSNYKVDLQSQLVESSRKSSLVFLMNNILDKIDEELKGDYNNDGVRNLSSQLIGRIAALSIAFRPYRYLNENGAISSKLLSPERAQLLISILESNLDDRTYETLFKKSDFSYSDLSNSVFDSLRFLNINLEHSNLNNCRFSNCVFLYCQLSNSYSNSLNMDYVEIIESDLSDIKIENSKITRLSGEGNKILTPRNRTTSLVEIY